MIVNDTPVKRAARELRAINNLNTAVQWQNILNRLAPAELLAREFWERASPRQRAYWKLEAEILPLLPFPTKARTVRLYASSNGTYTASSGPGLTFVLLLLMLPVLVAVALVWVAWQVLLFIYVLCSGRNT